ncbi:MAG: RNA polymerase factor sigma-54 [Syntrophales bacterium]|nr:RNA polymerase factor sigma-54 [Syntrophales bacterium]
MVYELKQNLKLSQQLVMTPQLQQAIKLLQLSRLEIEQVILREMEENPVLEETPTEDEISEEAGLVDLGAVEKTDVVVSEKTREITGEGDGKDEFDWESYLEDFGPVGVAYEREEEERKAWDNFLTKSPSMLDHLMWQLRLSPFTEREMRIGAQIIGNLDPNGYLVVTVEEIAQQEGVGVDEVEEVLRKVQGFDPPGIAARDLKECLLIQAEALGIREGLVGRIIQEHLKDLETKNYAIIAKKLKVSVKAVLEAVSIISNMDPKPGRMFQEERVQTIIPDVFVIKSGDDFKIVLNEDGLPRLRISNYYRELMAGLIDNSPDAEKGKKYIKEKIQSATWLIKSIQQRQRTIYRVAESIVKFQREFFEKGIQYLKPLVLRDVASDVGMHESTISRVVTNKYMQTPFGVFEMKYFFSSGLPMSGGGPVASKSVMEEIRRIIGEEDPAKPLSDSEIAQTLKKRGVNIARRTVAKYREMMNILPSSKRKRITLR